MNDKHSYHCPGSTERKTFLEHIPSQRYSQARERETLVDVVPGTQCNHCIYVFNKLENYPYRPILIFCHFH